MQLNIISQTGIVLELPSFTSVSLMTESGMVTILPHHEPLLSALKPGIMNVTYEESAKSHAKSYVTGGGVLNVSTDQVTIISDMVDADDDLSDLEYIKSQKEEAERLVEIYKSENSETIDPERLIAIEKDLMRYSLMHELGKKYRESGSGNRG